MNRFLDETNIKKMPPPPPPELIKQTVNVPKDTPKAVPQPEPKYVAQREVKEEMQQPVVLDKEAKYHEEVDKINAEVNFEYPKHGVNIQMTEKHDKPKEDKPIYQVSRNAGKVEVQTEAFKTQAVNRVDIVDRKDTLRMMVNKSRNDLLEQQIELEIISQMRNKVAENRKKALDAKMKAQTEKVKEISLRISILETIIKSEVKK